MEHANPLLNQILATSQVEHILCPNHHLVTWAVGFMRQWHHLTVEGNSTPGWLLQINTQPEVGDEAYARAPPSSPNFPRQVREFLTLDLHPLGRTIIEWCLNGGQIPSPPLHREPLNCLYRY